MRGVCGRGAGPGEVVVALVVAFFFTVSVVSLPLPSLLRKPPAGPPKPQFKTSPGLAALQFKTLPGLAALPLTFLMLEAD